MRRVLATALLLLAGCENPKLKACDEAIQATLKAPSTYKRIAAKGSGIVFAISYDAENSFGVPLRSEGNCYYGVVKGKKAEWIENPHSGQSLPD